MLPISHILNIFGLCLNLIGAICMGYYIAKGGAPAFYQKIKKLTKKSGLMRNPFEDYNTRLARTGICLLIVGFLMQIVAAMLGMLLV